MTIINGRGRSLIVAGIAGFAWAAVPSCGGSSKNDAAAGGGGQGGQGGGQGGVSGDGPAGGGDKGGSGGDISHPEAGGEVRDAVKEAALPPTPNPLARRLTTEHATLVGTGDNSCTNDTEGAGDTWCAFTKPSDALGKNELWVIDVTAAAAASSMVSCAGAGDAHCKMLAADFYVQDNGIYSSGFAGRTLIFYSDQTSAAGENFAGNVQAWKPEWASGKPQKLASAGYACVPSSKGSYVYCIDTLDTSMMGMYTFNYLAGPLMDGGPMAALQDNVVCCEDTGRKYSARFTADEKYFVWSTRHALADNETFYYKPVADLAAGMAKPGTKFLADGSSRVTFSADSSKIFYLKGYNYDTSGSPSGDLIMNTWPIPTGGGTPTMIDSKVGSVGPLTLNGADKGIFYYRNMAMYTGEFWMARNAADIGASKVKVLASTCDVMGISPSYDRLVFAKTCDATTGLEDAYAMAIDKNTAAPGGECAMTTGMMSTTFGLPSLSDDGKWAFFVDNVDTSVNVGDGKLVDLAKCTTTSFGRAVWAWTWAGSAGFVENDDSDGTDATLRAVDLEGGAPSAPGAGACDFDAGCIQQSGQVTYAMPPPYHFVLFTISKSSPAIDGLWYFEKLPWGPAAAGDAGADAAKD